MLGAALGDRSSGNELILILTGCWRKKRVERKIKRMRKMEGEWKIERSSHPALHPSDRQEIELEKKTMTQKMGEQRGSQQEHKREEQDVDEEGQQQEQVGRPEEEEREIAEGEDEEGVRAGN